MTKANSNQAGAELTATNSAQPLPEGEPPEGVSGLIAEYPGLAIAAGIGIGLLVGALLPRSAGRKIARGAVFLASAGGEIGLALGKQAFQAADEATREGRERLTETATGVAQNITERASDLGHKATDAGRNANINAKRLAGDASERARDVGAGIAKLAIDAVTRIRN